MTDEIRSKVERVKEGNASALDTYIYFKDVEQVLKLALEELKQEAIDDATRYEGNSFTHLNAKITLKKDAGKWDFSHIDKWKYQASELKKIERNSKDAFNSAKDGFVLTDWEGDVVEPAIFNEGKINISVQIIDNEVTQKLPFD